MRSYNRTLTYLLYEGIEPVDLAAIGVMSMAKRVIPQLTYETVAATNAQVVFSNGLRPKSLPAERW